MRPGCTIFFMLCLVGACGAASAQERNAGPSAAADTSADSTGRADGVPIERIIAAVAKKTGKKYLIDTRVHGPVEIVGQDISTITYPDAQWVTTVIAIKNVPAATLVPILRPLLPVSAHLAAAVCSNSLLITDTFAKVRLLEKLVSSLDVGSPYVPRSCEAESAHPPGNPSAHP
jgi:type II secretory pathway component GspD/PulD (secretin)